MATLGNTPRPAYVYDTETDTWVPVGVGAHTHAYIPNTLVDAKGDLITATANDVPAILSKGADGTVLVSDSTTQTGLAWQPYVAPFMAGKNKVINGDFSINQRNATSTTSAWAFLADRWKTTSFSGSATWSISTIDYGSFSRQVSNKALRITSSSSSNDHGFQQSIEDVTTLAGQTVTVSFWARSNSSSYGLDLVELMQYFGSGGSANVYNYFDCSTKTITNTWQKIEMTITLPSVTGKTIGSGNYLNLRIDPTATLPNGAWIEITHIQLEAGPVATPFTTATGTIQGELAACQRYYFRVNAFSTSSYAIFGAGAGNSTTQARTIVPFPVTMRVKPTSIDYPTVGSNFAIIGYDDSINVAPTAAALDTNQSDTQSGYILWTASSGVVASRPLVVRGQATTNAYLGFSAEL